MKQPNILPDVLTAEEVSLLLRIPLATVYHLSKQKKIRGVKIGKHWRYLASDIFRFFETREEIQNGVSV